MLVKVYESSINPVDTGIRYGLFKGLTRFKLSYVLRIDVSDKLVEVGVTGIKMVNGYYEQN
jgi:NADPH:quinone reductase-like Zn-dependent oxidoreductase